MPRVLRVQKELFLNHVLNIAAFSFTWIPLCWLHFLAFGISLNHRISAGFKDVSRFFLLN